MLLMIGTWARGVPSLPNSLECFETLVTRFGIKFDTSRPHHLTSLALVNIWKVKGESLCVFKEHYNKVALNIHNVTFHHLVTALQPRTAHRQLM